MVTDVRARTRDGGAGLLLAAVACVLGLLVTCAVFVWTPAGQELDQLLLAVPGRDGAADGAAMALLSVVGDPLVLAVVLGGVLVAGMLSGRTRAALAGIVLFGCSVAGARVLKSVVTRPDLDVTGSTTHNSFPSGHVAATTAIVLAVLLVLPAKVRWWAAVPGLAGAVLVGAATMIAGWHRLSDVLGAMLLAGAIGCVAFWSAGGARRRL